jgi:hypothetical protein
MLSRAWAAFRAWAQPPFFSAREAVILSAGFFATLVLLNRFLHWFHTQVYLFDFPPYWPVTGYPKWPLALGYVLAGLSLTLFALVARRVCSHGSLAIAMLGGVALIAITNLFHGVHVGYFNPIATNPRDGIEYWHDAVKLEGAREFLRTFNEHQPQLLTHSRTHPPGAVLIFYGMHRLGMSPEQMALALAVVAGFASAWLVFSLARRFGSDDIAAGFAALLFLVLPSTQVFYLASLDALIAALFTAALCCFVARNLVLVVLGTSCAAIAAGSLTFSFLFLLPVIAGYDFIWRRRAVYAAAVGLIVVLGLVGFHYVLGVDYVAAFQTASRLENPNGPMLIDQPLSYAATRLENVCDILLFLGPLTAALLVKSFARSAAETRELRIVASGGIATLLAMFLTGAFRTGETSRACGFIYPYLVLPALAQLRDSAQPARDRLVLSSATFCQAVLMQLFGYFRW